MNATLHLMNMEFMKNRDFAKKRIMFIPKEDYNYLIYNTLLILNELNCLSEATAFNDFRKIAYILDFINTNKAIAEYTQEELSSIYLKAQVKKKLLSHILIILRNNNYIGISINPRHQTFDIWMNKDNIPTDFWDDNLFILDREQFLALKKNVRSLRLTTIKTLAQKLFGDKNVLVWEI